MTIPFLDSNSPREYLNPSNPTDRRMLAELTHLAVSTGSLQIESIHFLQSYELMLDGQLGPLNSAGLTAVLQRFHQLYINEGSTYQLNISSALRSRFQQLLDAAANPLVMPRPTDIEMLRVLRDIRREMVDILRNDDNTRGARSTVREYRERAYSEFRSDPTRTDTLVGDTLRDHLREVTPVETRGRR